MRAKQPLNVAVRNNAHKDQQQPEHPFTRQPSYWKKALTVLLCCLAIFCLLTSPSSTRFVNQTAAPSTPFNPVGDAAIVTAPGFDTCVAPPADLLKTWWDKSPYRWLNVYLGGTSMFPTCGGKNLTPAWIRTVYEQGWSLLPTWVGLQAPCAPQHAVMSSNAASSYVQGQVEANAAIAAANRLGFSNTAPIYFDMEHFNPTQKNGRRDTACIQAVNAFLEGWNNELVGRNHFAGVYASASNYPLLDSAIVATSTMAWIAGGSSWTEKYDRRCSVFGNAFISDHRWNSHQRIYQYTGGHKETYGQKTWNIDSDCADAPMVGHLTTISIAVQFQSP